MTDDDTVSIAIPATPDHVVLLRALVGMYAARLDFTLDELDDLRMAVEEAAIQLLRRSTGDRIELAVRSTPSGIDARLSGTVPPGQAVVDRDSFSWMILQALTDDVEVGTAEGHAMVQLLKARSVTSETTAGTT